MAYVDGFLTPVKADRLAEYKKMARKAGKVWMEHGALSYTECLADDVAYGKSTSFLRAVKQKDDEVVVLSWVVYNSRRERDQIMKKVMEDPRLADMIQSKDQPFDTKRMIFGGFKPIVEL